METSVAGAARTSSNIQKIIKNLSDLFFNGEHALALPESAICNFQFKPIYQNNLKNPTLSVTSLAFGTLTGLTT